MHPYLVEKLRDLTDDNLSQKIQDLITEIGDTNYTNNVQTDLMFTLHNRAYPDSKESSKGCGACRLRVYNRLIEYLKNDNSK
jgi:hypothetical protein